MGASCGIIKKGGKATQSKQTVVLEPRYTITSRRIDPTKARKLIDVDPSQALIGPYFMQDEFAKTMPDWIKKKQESRLCKWHKMAGHDPTLGAGDMEQIEQNLESYLLEHARIFQRRLCKGPPPMYRWVAWKIQSRSKMPRVEGAYDELLKKIHAGEYNHTINKDLDRTFPEHPFFQKNKYGNIGQELLGRALKVYAHYNEKIGYCQGMNFILAFLLMVNGGSDEEAFWFFVAITKKHQNFEADRIFDGGLEGFFQEGFPLMRQFMFQFEFLFEQKMPKLKKHFEDEGLASALWIQKWFMTLFLYSFPLSLVIRLWDNVLVYGIVFLFQVPLAVLKINQDKLLSLRFEDLNVFLNSFKDINLLNAEEVIQVAQKMKIREKTLMELKHLFNESIKDMDNSKPVRRLLVIPELKDESADEGSESERKAQINTSAAILSGQGEDEQGIQRKNSEISQKQSSQDKEQSLRSYVYSKGQLVRVSQIDRMLTREDLHLDDSNYYESRQNSSQMPRMVSNELGQAPSTKNFSAKDEEFKLPPIHQNRPSISTVIFPTFDDKILMVQRPISSHETIQRFDSSSSHINLKEATDSDQPDTSRQSSFKVIGHVFDYHSMNEAIESKSGNRGGGAAARKKKKMKQKQQAMFINKLGHHHMNNTAVFSDDELDNQILGDQQCGEEIKEEIQEDDSDEFDFVVEQLDQQTDDFQQKQQMKIDTSKYEDSQNQNNYSSQYFRADSDMISDSQLHLSHGLSGRHGDILRALQQQKNTPEINNEHVYQKLVSDILYDMDDSESEDAAKHSLNVDELCEEDEKENAENESVVSSLGGLPGGSLVSHGGKVGEQIMPDLNLHRMGSNPIQEEDLFGTLANSPQNKQYRNIVNTPSYYEFYHSFKPRDPRLPKPTYVPNNPNLIGLDPASEGQSILNKRSESPSQQQDAFQLQTTQIQPSNLGSVGAQANQLSNQLSQMDLEGAGSSPMQKGVSQMQHHTAPINHTSSGSLGGQGDPFMGSLGFGMQQPGLNNDWGSGPMGYNPQGQDQWGNPNYQQPGGHRHQQNQLYDSMNPAGNQYDPNNPNQMGGQMFQGGGNNYMMNQHQNYQMQQPPQNQMGFNQQQMYPPQQFQQPHYNNYGPNQGNQRGGYRRRGERGGNRNSFQGQGRGGGFMNQQDPSMGGNFGNNNYQMNQMNKQQPNQQMPPYNNRNQNFQGMMYDGNQSMMQNQMGYNQMNQNPAGNNYMNPMMSSPQIPMDPSLGQFDNRGKKTKSNLKRNQQQMMLQNEAPKSEFLEDLRQKISYNKKIEIADIKDHVVECSKDQYGSRFIQQKYEMATTEEKDMIFQEIIPEALSLMTDVFGNYVIQKLFEYGFSNHRATLADQMISHVLELTKHMYGCRVVQKAIEEIGFQQQKLLVTELKDHILSCVYDQNGNHVIQKCIEKMSPHSIEFILKPIIENITDLCVHNYGCRVVQRVLEYCNRETIDNIVPEILRRISDMMIDPFGNYVIQHLLEHGKIQEYKNQIVRSMLGNVLNYSNHKFASNVVEKCLEYGEQVDIEKIIDEVIHDPSDDKEPFQPLYQMMKDKYGNYVVQKGVEKGNEKQKENLLRKIQSVASIIRRQANYSRHVFTFLEKLQNDGLITGVNLDQGPLPGPGMPPGRKEKKQGGQQMMNNGGMMPMQTMGPFGGPQAMGNFMGQGPGMQGQPMQGPGMAGQPMQGQPMQGGGMGGMMGGMMGMDGSCQWKGNDLGGMGGMMMGGGPQSMQMKMYR